MSQSLYDAIDNAEFLLESSIPAMADGTFEPLPEAHGVAACYRSRGLSKLLLSGVVEPLQVAQMQSASIYLFALSRASEEQKVTSLGGCWWDAVGAQYWSAAAEIAQASRMTPNLAKEHEDDFLYVAYLMQRYFLAPKADAPGDEQEAHARAQQQRLDRWDVVLEGDLDARLSLCRALASQQRDDVEEALLAVADDRQRDVKRRGDKGALTREELAWIEPVWPEGLAVLRLAARDGLVRPGLQIPGVPPVVRVDNSHVFHPDAWRSLDFRPVRRPGPG